MTSRKQLQWLFANFVVKSVENNHRSCQRTFAVQKLLYKINNWYLIVVELKPGKNNVDYYKMHSIREFMLAGLIQSDSLYSALF